MASGAEHQRLRNKEDPESVKGVFTKWEMIVGSRVNERSSALAGGFYLRFSNLWHKDPSEIATIVANPNHQEYPGDLFYGQTAEDVSSVAQGVKFLAESKTTSGMSYPALLRHMLAATREIGVKQVEGLLNRPEFMSKLTDFTQPSIQPAKNEIASDIYAAIPSVVSTTNEDRLGVLNKLLFDPDCPGPILEKAFHIFKEGKITSYEDIIDYAKSPTFIDLSRLDNLPSARSAILMNLGVSEEPLPIDLPDLVSHAIAIINYVAVKARNEAAIIDRVEKMLSVKTWRDLSDLVLGLNFLLSKDQKEGVPIRSLATVSFEPQEPQSVLIATISDGVPRSEVVTPIPLVDFTNNVSPQQEIPPEAVEELVEQVEKIPFEKVVSNAQEVLGEKLEAKAYQFTKSKLSQGLKRSHLTRIHTLMIKGGLSPDDALTKYMCAFIYLDKIVKAETSEVIEEQIEIAGDLKKKLDDFALHSDIPKEDLSLIQLFIGASGRQREHFLRIFPWIFSDQQALNWLRKKVRPFTDELASLSTVDEQLPIEPYPWAEQRHNDYDPSAHGTQEWFAALFTRDKPHLEQEDRRRVTYMLEEIIEKNFSEGAQIIELMSDKQENHGLDIIDATISARMAKFIHDARWDKETPDVALLVGNICKRFLEKRQGVNSRKTPLIASLEEDIHALKLSTLRKRILSKSKQYEVMLEFLFYSDTKNREDSRYQRGMHMLLRIPQEGAIHNLAKEYIGRDDWVITRVGATPEIRQKAEEDLAFVEQRLREACKSYNLKLSVSTP